jgi:hypothetical protein
MVFCPVMAVRACEVSYRDHLGIRHSVEVNAETLYEAVVKATTVFRKDPWLEKIGRGTMLTVAVREPVVNHTITLQQVERWLSSSSPSPMEHSKKAKLSLMLVRG